MNEKDARISYRLVKTFRNLHLLIKVAFLFICAFALFPFFIGDKELEFYFYFLCILVFFMALLCRLVVGRKEFKTILWLWFIGAIIYLVIAIPYIYTRHEITPHLKLETLYDCWLYTLALPIRLLGLFSCGLIFIRIISPIEFLKWGNWGYAIALLFRVIEQSTQKIHETKIAMLMQNNWPEEREGLIRFTEAYLIIKNSPKLIITTIRNMIVWFPWAWLCFKRLKTNLKGDH